VKRSEETWGLSPDGVITRTEWVDVVWAGDTAVIEVSEFTVKLLAAIAPKMTLVVPVNSVPVITTLVPPTTGPDVGEMEVTAGAIAVHWA
jgi:hypothetical protein